MKDGSVLLSLKLEAPTDLGLAFKFYKSRVALTGACWLEMSAIF